MAHNINWLLRPCLVPSTKKKYNMKKIKMGDG